MNFITLTNNNTYIESKDLKVFPCAYRGYYEGNDYKVFDPEARSTTEANFTDTFHKLSSDKESYVISWTPDISNVNGANEVIGTLRCVIGGYYFEIYNHSLNEFFYNSEDAYYLCIQTKDQDLGTDANFDGSRKTKVLSSFQTDVEEYLDIRTTSANVTDSDFANKYIFTGLLLSQDPIGSAYLKPFITGVDYIKAGTISSQEENKNTYINKYYKGADGKLVAIGEDLANLPAAGTQIYLKSEQYKVDSSTLLITNLLDLGNGKYSVRMLEDVTEQGSNTTIADGAYSVALGKSTEASGEASTALGNNSKASAKGAFAAGNNTEASGEGAVALGSTTTASGTNAVALGDNTAASGANSIALGSNTKAEADNQVVIGAYNEKDDNQAFIIANGTVTAKSNKFTVSKTGDVKALGTLETKGSISAAGNSNNELVLGTSVANSSGSIKVYGAGADLVFSVENSGNTTIAGTTDISGDTSIAGDASITKALTVAGGVSIGENLNVGGSTTLNNTLTVSGEHETKLGGSLQVSGDTTLTQKLNVTGTTELNNNLSVVGNTTIAASTANNGVTATNTLIIGNTTENISGALDIYGTGTSKVFSVANTGNTSIAGDTSIIKNTPSTNTTSGALKVAGGVGIGGNLNVGGTTTLNDALTVANGKTTTLSGDTTITSGTGYTAGADFGTTTAALKVAGGVHVAEKLNVGTDVSIGNTLSVLNGKVSVEPYSSTSTNSPAVLKVGATAGGGYLYVYGSSGQTTDQTNDNGRVFSIDSAGNTSIGGTATIEGVTTINNNTTANADNGALKVTGGIKAGNAYINGVTTITGATIVGGKLTVNNEASITGKLEVGNTTKVTINEGAISGITDLGLTGKLNVGSTITAGGNITTEGRVEASYFNATYGTTSNSDRRLKCNIEDYKFEKSILELPIKRFEYIKDETHTKYVGCIAQDLQEICPELVVENSDGMLSIQESKLIYMLLQEVKELKEKVEQLERR